MEPLTREQKYQVYSHALQIIGDFQFGLCHALWQGLRAKTEFLEVTTLKWKESTFQLLFPEVWKHKPEDNTHHPFWFALSDRPPRINILEQAIKEVSPPTLPDVSQLDEMFEDGDSC